MAVHFYPELYLVVFLMTAIAQFAFLFLLHARIAFYRNKTQNAEQPAVSVIIAARNEEENLSTYLPCVLEQDYPDFEVVVVNDSSVDKTSVVLKSLEKQYARLRCIDVKKSDSTDGGKKMAITLGVNSARNERLIFTDADCRPVSNKWIQTLMRSRTMNCNLILGYSPYARQTGFLNKIIRFETFINALNYLSFASVGLPYMGVGRNLSYTKSLFRKVEGFKSHQTLASGDDDLFVNQAANRSNTDICIDNEAIVESFPKESWREFWRQKRRHLSTGFTYKLYHKFLLIAQPLSLILFWFSGAFLLVSHNWVEITLVVITFRVTAQLYIFKRSSRWLGQADLIAFAPIFEILIVLLTTCAHAANAVSTRVTWKK